MEILDHADATEVPVRSSNIPERRTAGAKQIPGPSAVWTNEKHNSYLHSLEASFVKQLHQAISLRGCLQKVVRRPCSSIQANDCNSLQKITFQRYSKQKINCEGNEDLLESTSDSHFIEGSRPPMHHLASVDTEPSSSSDLHTALGKDGKRMRSELPVSSASTQSSNDTDGWCLSYRDSTHSFLEVSDQNFVDGDAEDKLTSASRLKRSKIDAPNDQVIHWTCLVTHYML